MNYRKFFFNLGSIVEELNFKKNEVKVLLGDSIANHRTLTVSQVIRYLRTNKRNIVLANNLEKVFNILKDDILENRNNNRKDAIDINEFINYYQDEVIVDNYDNLRRKINRKLIA